MRPPIGALALLTLATAILVAGPAQAIYIVTPLRLDPSSAEGEVGDAIAFRVTPSEDWNGTSYHGRTVLFHWSYDPQEGQREPSSDPDGTVGSDDGNATDPEPTHVERSGPSVVLDGGSRATFTWAIPDEVADRNVFITLRDDAGEILANAHVRVGDAAPMAFIMAEGAPAGAEPIDPPVQDDVTDTRATNEAPGAGALLVGAALAVGALLALRRRA